MSGGKGGTTIVLKIVGAPDVTVALSDCLEVLGSDMRLKILKLLQSEPMDVETICTQLSKKYGLSRGRENTKKHIDKLMRIGLVVQQPGVRDERPVFKYVLTAGGIEATVRTLNKVMGLDLRVAQVRSMITEEFSENFPLVRVLGGVDDGKKILLNKDEVKVGRVDPEKTDGYDPENDVVLSEEYGAVSRVWRPHTKLTLEEGRWNIEHCEGTNPTWIWNESKDEYEKLRKNVKYKLKNGDIINLADIKGTKCAKLLFTLPKPKQKQQETTQ